MNAKDIIEQLQLKAHPEGGYYRETYRDNLQHRLEDGRSRNTATAIYYLLSDSDTSHFHKVASDELWFFHQGETVEIFILPEDGKLQTRILGNRLDAGEVPQVLVEANTLFAAKIRGEKGFALVSCVVAPGFDFNDFELAHKKELISLYPHLRKEIERLALDSPPGPSHGG